MSNLSDLLPSGGGQNIVEFTASGTISSGQAVGLKSDGTVEAITGATEGVGTAVVFETGAGVSYITSVFDSSNNKVVISYRDQGNSNYGTAVVGTISGTSISFGTPVIFNSGNPTNYISSTFDSNSNKVVICYNDGGDGANTNAVVGTVSGTSISFGSEVTIFTDSIGDPNSAMAFDSTNNKVLLVYKNATVSQHGYAVVGTVSGTSSSWGSQAAFETGGATEELAVDFDSSAGKFVIAYKQSTGYAIVGTISGTSISFGSRATLDSSTIQKTSVVYDSTNNKTVIAYRDNGNSGYGTARVGTVSGTSISFGSEVVFESASTDHVGGCFDSNAGKVVFCYKDGGNSGYGTYQVGTVSGTSISFAGAQVYESGSSSGNSPAFDSNLNKIAIAFEDGGNSDQGTGVVLQLTSTNVSSFIGLADAAISDTATGKINVKGSINSKQSSLTIGSDYYVQSDGTVATTSTSPAVKIGQAVTATTINMMDLT